MATLRCQDSGGSGQGTDKEGTDKEGTEKEDSRTDPDAC
jgi:hypothetical protein